MLNIFWTVKTTELHECQFFCITLQLFAKAVGLTRNYYLQLLQPTNRFYISVEVYKGQKVFFFRIFIRLHYIFPQLNRSHYKKCKKCVHELCSLCIRYHLRLFGQVRHEITNASSGNQYLFTKLCSETSVVRPITLIKDFRKANRQIICTKIQ